MRIEIHWKCVKMPDISCVAKPSGRHYVVHRYLLPSLTVIEIRSDVPTMMHVMVPQPHHVTSVQIYDVNEYPIDVVPVNIAKYEKYEVFENGTHQTRRLENGKYISCEIISIEGTTNESSL